MYTTRNKERKMPAPIKISPEEEAKLSTYQRMLLVELQSKPEIMQLLKVIFNDYPQVIQVEYITSKSATKKRLKKSLECSALRMKMEAYIEDKIARLAGIDVDKLAALQREVDAQEKKLNEATDNMAKEIAQEQDQKALEAIGQKVTSDKGESNG